jgi:hypothetical protein
MTLRVNIESGVDFHFKELPVDCLFQIISKFIPKKKASAFLSIIV